jgi:hypothetical protein
LSHPKSTLILVIAYQSNPTRFLIRQLSGKPDPMDQVFVVNYNEDISYRDVWQISFQEINLDED